MTLRTRLHRLEAVVHQTDATQTQPEYLTEDDWLELFEAWGREGNFDHEPDFPQALATYRNALNEAKQQIDPPFDPPEDFLPGLSDLPELRLLNWRHQFRFPQLHEAWEWLREMHHRLVEGITPVSEAEFKELADWFLAHDRRLYQLSLPTQLLDLDDGRRTWTAQIRYGVSKGPRATGAGKLAEDLRRLRERYGP